MHVFKRFYLITALVASFCIPVITFTSYVSVAPMDGAILTPHNITANGLDNTNLWTNYLSIILWTLYGLGALVFLLKFMFNLASIITKIYKNPRYKNTPFINVLLEGLATPHTFLNYIFLDKYKFEAKRIPKEVIIHEQTHARQKHTLDILFIEFFQIVFWFNPLIYFIKHAIKLNHEFLADKAVLNRGTSTSVYQKILLNFASTNHHPQLTNAINYSFIKKRFIIMKTHTSKKTSWLRSLILLPLLAGLVYGFSEKVTIEKITPKIEEIQSDKTKQENINHKGNQDKATPQQVAEYNKLAKHYNAMSKENMIVKQKDVERLEYIYALMSEAQKKKAESFPNFPPPPPPPPIHEGYSSKGSKELQLAAKQFSEKAENYGKAVRNYNRTKKGQNDLKPIYNEVMSLYNAYAKLAKKENIIWAPPPPAPPAPSFERVYKGQNSNIPPPPPTPPNPLDHMIALAKKGATFYYEDDKISSDKAIAIVKKNKSINIQVREHNSNNPIVKLSKKPITFKRN